MSFQERALRRIDQAEKILENGLPDASSLSDWQTGSMNLVKALDPVAFEQLCLWLDERDIAYPAGVFAKSAGTGPLTEDSIGHILDVLRNLANPESAKPVVAAETNEPEPLGRFSEGERRTVLEGPASAEKKKQLAALVRKARGEENLGPEDAPEKPTTTQVDEEEPASAEDRTTGPQSSSRRNRW